MLATNHLKAPRQRRDDQMIRLRDPQTGAYLHLNGETTTPTTAHAWLGTRKQANSLQQKAKANGQPWPYHRYPR